MITQQKKIYQWLALLPIFFHETTLKVNHKFLIRQLLMAAIILWPMLLNAGDFYLSPTGNDANPGTIQKPFATLHRVQKAIAAEKGKPVTVFLRGGTYYLSETFSITSDLSRTKDAPVVIQAYQNEQPVLSGGILLKLKWSPFQGKIIKAQVPKGLQTDQIFINGVRQHMARYPNYDSTAKYFDGFSADAFSPARAARWNNPKGGFIHTMHRSLWGDFHYIITRKDTANRVQYEGGWQNNRRMGMHPTFRFVENIFEELDAPGEWFLDNNTGTLYFYPPTGIDINKATIEAVRLRHLVEFKGTEEKPVKYVSFKGITFRHTVRTFMDNKEPLLRSDWTVYRGGAILFNGAENCTIEDCFLDQLGGNGIFVNNYNRNITIRGCHLANLGGNGIAFVGDPKAVRSPLFEYQEVQPLDSIDKTPGPKTNNYPAKCTVDNCLIYRTGRFEKQTAPVEIDMAQDITVRYCSIYDVPRAGINIGDGCWGGHIIEYCDVFETVKETGDHGSFNSWGRDRFWRPKIEEVNEWVKQVPELPLLDVVKTNILRNNRWRCDHGWDIDLDDGSSNYHIYNNLCLNGGIKNREGFNRIVENNITVNNTYFPHAWFANSGDVVRKNIFWEIYRPARMYNPPWGKEMDFNLRHSKGVAPRPDTLMQKKSGRDENSLTGDALFIDPANGDFRVKEGSPALTLGFLNFPMDQFGVQKPALKSIARQPQIPVQKQVELKRDGTVKEWAGIKVRNIMDEGEMSVYGLPGITGVLIVDMGTDKIFAAKGLQKDDVILSVNEQKIEKVDDLSSYEPTKVERLRISRNQKEIVLK